MIEDELIFPNVLLLAECKDEPAAHETCAKVLKELGIQVCHVKIEQLRYKLERSCAKTCNYCK